MARDLEKINEARKAKGLAPLDKLPEEVPAGSNSDDPPTDDLPKSDQPPAGAPPAAKKDPPPAALPLELDESQLLKALQDKGIPVTSLEDLRPKADPEKTAEQREAAKLSYALTKGLYSTKDHENYIREKSNPRDLVFGQFYDEAKKDDPTLTDEEIQAEFDEKYGISADPGTRKHKRGVQEIALLADRILRDKYGKIYSAEETYSKYEGQENTKNERNRKVLAEAPAYKREVEQVFEGLKTIKVPVSDTESYDVIVTAEALQAAKAEFLDPDTCAAQIIKGYSTESLRDLAETVLLKQNFQALSLELAKQYHLKRQAGSKGIPPAGRIERRGERVLTDDQKRILADHNIKEEDLAPVSQ